MLGAGTTDGINDSTRAEEKTFSINFGKANLHYNGGESYLYVNKTEICKFKAKDNISWCNFCLGNVSRDFTKDEQREISLNGTVYDFSFDHSSIKKEDILNIHQYLMIKNKIEAFLGLLKQYLLDY